MKNEVDQFIQSSKKRREMQEQENDRSPPQKNASVEIKPKTRREYA